MSSTSADALAILGLMNLPKVGSARIHRILDALVANGGVPALLLDYDEASLVEEGLLSGEEAARFLSDEERDWRASVGELINDAGVCVTSITSEHYPAYLREQPRTLVPPLLFTAGDAALLRFPGIAIAGSRSLSEGGGTVTEVLAQHAAEKRFTIVSGGAKGADSIAHEQAVRAGGKTIVVLAEGMLTPRARHLAEMASEGNMIVVSTCLPQDPWQTWRAMERNKYILGLSDRLIVIEAGQRGGSLAAGKDALRQGVDTWVVDYESPPESAAGNATLLENGARPIPVSASFDVDVPPALFAIGEWTVRFIGR